MTVGAHQAIGTTVPPWAGGGPQGPPGPPGPNAITSARRSIAAQDASGGAGIPFVWRNIAPQVNINPAANSMLLLVAYVPTDTPAVSWTPELRILLDGAPVAFTKAGDPITAFPLSLNTLRAIAAGAHTIDIQMQCQTGADPGAFPILGCELDYLYWAV